MRPVNQRIYAVLSGLDGLIRPLSEDMKAFQWLMHNLEGVITVKYHGRYAEVITRPGWQELLHR